MYRNGVNHARSNWMKIRSKSVHFIVLSSDPQNVVASDENLSEVSSLGSVDPLLSVCQLQVHVAVDRHKQTSVLHSPLQLAHDFLAREAVEEGLGVDGLKGRHLQK
ncbi:hypothetical protein PFISCL1PPCAC_8205, partial [Pristionchus fissidentatus]